MNCDGWEIAFSEQLVELGRSEGALDENDDLVKLKLIEKLIELAVLLLLCKRNVVLLETVQSQFGVFVDVMLCWVLHELPADGLDLV